MKRFSWERLRNVPTICVNGAIMDVPNPDYFLTACSGFSNQAHRSHFWNTKAHRILVMKSDHKRWHKVEPFIQEFDEVVPPYRYDGQIGFSWDKFATGKNSGFCALQYAVLRGYHDIRLVGFDLQSTGGHHYGQGGPRSSTIETFYNHFVTGIKILLNANYDIISHTPTSRLNSLIPYMEFPQ